MAAPNAALALVVMLGLAAVTAPSAQAKTLIVLFSLDPHDGAGPRGELIQGTNGDLYGTTVYGAVNGEGAVFKFTESGTLTTLYSFCAQTNCADGANPNFSAARRRLCCNS